MIPVVHAVVCRGRRPWRVTRPRAATEILLCPRRPVFACLSDR